MKSHPGHFWICFWLVAILLFGESDTLSRLDKLIASQARIEAQLDTLLARVP